MMENGFYYDVDENWKVNSADRVTQIGYVTDQVSLSITCVGRVSHP